MRGERFIKSFTKDILVNMLNLEVQGESMELQEEWVQPKLMGKPIMLIYQQHHYPT